MNAQRLWIAAVLVASVVGAPAAAQTNRGDGSQTGDGTTPFTGLAQAPEANLFVGAAMTTVPIQVPPGRKSVTPKLALTYNSNGGPSPYGYGWDVGLPRVQRATKRGRLSCIDPTYRNDFVVSLPGASLECRRRADGRCVPNVEDAFIKVLWNGGTAQTFTAWDKGGMKYTFGGNTASVDGVSFTAPARTGSGTAADFTALPGGRCTYAATWALTEVRDTNGNVMELQYVARDGMLLPHAIHYGKGTQFPSHLFEVRFDWESRCLVPDVDGRCPTAVPPPPGEYEEPLNSVFGHGARLTRRLWRIRVLAQGQLVRAYVFDYATGRRGRQTFLAMVTLQGADGMELARADGLAAGTTFDYHEPLAGFLATSQVPAKPALRTPHSGHGADPGRMRWTDADDGTRRDVLDMNADGFADLVDAWPIHEQIDGCPGVPANPAGPGDYWDVYFGSKHGFSTTRTAWYVPHRDLMCDIRRSDNTTTWFTTVDLTGDGLPDFVDARTTPWKVYPGSATSPSGSWGFKGGAGVITWAAPAPYAQVTNLGQSMGGWSGKTVRQDLIDMTGDGLLDLVSTPAGQPAPNPTAWSIAPNVRTGFGAIESFHGAFGALSFLSQSASDNGTIYGTWDVNGDGLPDGVYSQQSPGGAPLNGGAWRVCLNTGRDMSACENWAVPQYLGGQLGSSWRHIRKNGAEAQDALRDFLDINGDGLPDVVDRAGYHASANPNWQVLLNRGDGFEDAAVNWPAPFPQIRGGNAGGGSTFQDSFDINGDGLVDFINYENGGAATYRVYTAAGGAWTPNGATADENVAGCRPDLLVSTENGLGGATALRYRPSTQWVNDGGDGIPDLPFVLWTLTEIRRDDGMCNGPSCTTPGAHGATAILDYKHGRFDPVEREFRGFAEVVREELTASATAPRRGTHTYFHQGAALSGRIQQVYTYDASNDQSWFWQPIALTANAWECVSPSTGALIACPSQPLGDVWVRLRSVEERHFSNFSLITFRNAFTENLSWHQCQGKFYGNVKRTRRGTLGTDPATTNTYAEYACTDTASAYVVDKPINIRTRNHNDSVTVDEQWFFYDSQGYGVVGAGNVTRIESWLNQTDMNAPASCTRAPSGGGGGCVATTMTYDVRGSVTAVTDALGRRTTTIYDGANQIYPALVTGPAPLNHKVATAYDAGCGTLRSESVKYATAPPLAADHTEHRYDTFCRLERTYRPGDPRDAGAIPYRRYVYKLGGPQTPSVVATHLREPNHPSGQTVIATALSDALGRLVQQKTESVVDGVWLALAATTAYDALGRAETQYAPFSFGYVPAASFETFSPVPAGTGATTFAYDAVARPTRVTNPDGTYRTLEHAVAWQTTTKDECFNASGCAGGKLLERRDALGRIAEKWAYEEGDVLKARTRYEYDARARLTKTTQGDATSWNAATDIVTTYDSLGRKQSTTDPDGGGPSPWRYRYDWVGNLILQDDPRTGQSLRFCYDTADRVTAKLYASTDYPTLPSCTASYPKITYRYDSAANGVGRLYEVSDLTGTTRVEQYTLLGEPEFVQRLVGSVTAETQYTYDSAGHVTSIRYPDNELVRNAYDEVGRITQVSNAQGGPVYLQRLTYDLFGRPAGIQHGNGTTDMRSYGTAPASNYRLSRIQARAGGMPILSYHYAEYWPGGRLKKLVDDGPKPAAAMDATVDQYTYDGIGRLREADAPGTAPSRVYEHDIWGNLTRQDAVTITYDTAKKHTPAAYFDGQSGSFQHDASGNRTAKALMRADQQMYSYDADGRLSRIQLVADTIDLGYDHTGRRTKETWNGVVTHHLAEFLEVSETTLRKYYFAGDMLIASREAAAPASLITARAASAIEVAQSNGGKPILIVRLGHFTALAIGGAMAMGGLGLLLLPSGRRRSVLGLRLRPAHAVVVGTAVLINTLPWPLVIRPAGAQPPPSPTTVPLATIHHYHLDHLGSPQAITTGAGAVYQHLRYTPYGELRGTWSASGGSGGPAADQDRHLFTGYEMESRSGLQYAGARFYDAQLGLFLTHDPVRQFASPYAYTGWDPINDADPNGSCELICLAVIGFAIGFTTSTIQAAVNGASLPEALKAGAIGGAIGTVSAPIGAKILAPIIASTITNPLVSAGVSQSTAEIVSKALLLSASLGQGAYGASQGDYASLIGFALNFGASAQVSGETGADLGAADGVAASAAGSAAARSGAASFAQYVWSEVALAGRILWADTLGFVTAQLAGTPAATLHQYGRALQGLSEGDAAAFVANLALLPIAAVFPKDNLFGGLSWGYAQFGNNLGLVRTNGDVGNLAHDISLNELDWIALQWSNPGFLPQGPFSNLYRQLGTPSFYAVGAIQGESVSPQYRR
ncbi:MAG: toxin TcdB middle/N-terminal domain-containing protein [Candidatus Binatia bacterium]